MTAVLARAGAAGRTFRCSTEGIKGNAARPNPGPPERIKRCRALTTACARCVARADHQLVAREAGRALIACSGGSLHKRDGAWTALSTTTFGKPVSGVTVANLGRDGMLMLSVLQGSASARLTTRGSWFARTTMVEMAERAAT
jgi:hypothetical protein